MSTAPGHQVDISYGGPMNSISITVQHGADGQGNSGHHPFNSQSTLIEIQSPLNGDGSGHYNNSQTNLQVFSGGNATVRIVSSQPRELQLNTGGNGQQASTVSMQGPQTIIEARQTQGAPTGAAVQRRPPGAQQQHRNTNFHGSRHGRRGSRRGNRHNQSIIAGGVNRCQNAVAQNRRTANILPSRVYNTSWVQQAQGFVVGEVDDSDPTFVEQQQQQPSVDYAQAIPNGAQGQWVGQATTAHGHMMPQGPLNSFAAGQPQVFESAPPQYYHEATRIAWQNYEHGYIWVQGKVVMQPVVYAPMYPFAVYAPDMIWYR